MKHSERMLFRKSVLLKPLACLTLALSAISIVPTASATTKNSPGNDQLWCNGNGPNGTALDYAAIPGFPGDTLPFGPSTKDPNFGLNPPDTWDHYGMNQDLNNPPALGQAYETEGPYSVAKMVNDVYAVQLNYWNSIVNANPAFAGNDGYDEKQNTTFGHSPGHSCLMFSDLGSNRQSKFAFTITYPASPSTPDTRKKNPDGTGQSGEVEFNSLHPTAWPTFVPYVAGATSGGPTGYISAYKGCSWDANSCTVGSRVPKKGEQVDPPSLDINHFPEKLSDITSMLSTWSIDSNPYFGSPFDKDNTKQAWDASYDVWFDKTAHTAEGKAPYDTVRGQNDGLEIMIWQSHNGSYVDGPVHDSYGRATEGQSGYMQPVGHIRERAYINGVLYDVWTGRLNNPYFGYETSEVLKVAQVQGECQGTLNGSGKTCGVEWNVVSFVPTIDSHQNIGRHNDKSYNLKIYADYILGVNMGILHPKTPNSSDWYIVDINDQSPPQQRTVPLQCPASAMDNSLTATTAPCLDPSWYLMSVQVGFETWIGGNGLRSNNFTAYVNTAPTVSGTGELNSSGNPIIGSTAAFTVVDRGCGLPTSPNNHGYFTITGSATKGGPTITYPSFGSQDMGAQQANGEFSYTVTDPNFPIYGDAVVHTFSTCNPAGVDIAVFIDPSGRVFYSDGMTPIEGATVTLSYSTSGTQSGPFVTVSNDNSIMQSNDNTTNPMVSSLQGSYGWNVIPGWYKVTATFNGVSVTTAAQQVTATHAITGLNIVLPVTAPPSVAHPARVTSQWVVNNVVRQLTSPDSTANDAEMHAQPATSSWNTQDWVIEPVAGNNHVRLKNIRTGNYLTAQGTTPVEYAKVVGDSFRGDWTSEEWIVEPVAATNDVRLKNAFNLRYLTVVDNSTYSGIQMQTLSSQNWTSQRWVIQ